MRHRVSRVQPGRRATRIGHDGIAPWMTLPRKLTRGVVDLMARKGVATVVRDDVWIDEETGAVLVEFDRVSFPGTDPRVVQSWVDEWLANLG